MPFVLMSKVKNVFLESPFMQAWAFMYKHSNLIYAYSLRSFFGIQGHKIFFIVLYKMNKINCVNLQC